MRVRYRAENSLSISPVLTMIEKISLRKGKPGFCHAYDDNQPNHQASVLPVIIAFNLQRRG